jgi:hypothetical protein
MGTSEVEVHQLRVDVEGETTSAVLEVPRGFTSGLVVLAHGLSASRESSYLRRIASQLHALSMATVSMDAPLHGSRRHDAQPMAFEDWVEAWQGFWRSGGSARMVAEYKAVLDSCPEDLSALPVGYWGPLSQLRRASRGWRKIRDRAQQSSGNSEAMGS